MSMISTVLFGTQTRYWYTLPTALIANIELYGRAVRLYVSSDVRSHPISGILDDLSDKLPLQVVEVHGSYINTEPSMWRIRMLWEHGYTDPGFSFLCRDIDSVPTSDEIKAVLLWENSQYPVHSIRSFHLHDTLIMAGLCGFRPNELKFVTDQVPSYDKYVELYTKHSSQCPNFVWGCDQEGLRMLFNNLRPYILDCPIGNCGPHNQSLGIPTASKEAIAAVQISHLNADLVRICDEIMAQPWGEFKGFAGRPIGDTRKELKDILELGTKSGDAFKSVLDKNADYRSFYAHE